MVTMRRLLSRKVSLGAMLEFGLWMGLVHVIVGLVWTFLHYDTVTRLGDQWQTLVPAGAELVAFGVTTLLWPLMLIASVVCGG
jgi:hypothetical protein